jgi:hypothetical protein
MPVEPCVEEQMLNTWIEDTGVYLTLETPEEDEVTAEYCRASSEDYGRAWFPDSTRR